MSADENFKIRSAAKLYKIYSKQKLIVDLLIKKGIISQGDVSNMLGEINEKECRRFVEGLYKGVE